MKNQSPDKYSDVVKSLHEVLSTREKDVRTLPIAKVMKGLEKEGIDVNPMIADVKVMIAQKQEERRQKAVKARRLAIERLANLRECMEDIRNIKERVKDIFNDLGRVNPQLAAVCYEKLAGMKEEDMGVFLADLAFLEGGKNSDE